MGTRAKKERRETPIVNTKYEFAEDGVHLTTDCPFGKRTSLGKAFIIHVGSYDCLHCEYFISENQIDKIISCRGRK